MKIPVMSKLMSVMASILIIFLFALFQEAVAAGSAATGGAVVIKAHSLSKTGKKNVTTPKTKTNTLNRHLRLSP